MRRLASFARVIVFDKRGSGLSDPVDQTATIEERMDDIRAVMDAAGSARADVFGWSEGANIAAVFGASRPDRVSALVLYGAFAARYPRRGLSVGDCPGCMGALDTGGRGGKLGSGLQFDELAPTKFEDEALVRWWGRFERQSMSPRMAREVIRLDMELDIRDVLPSIHVPTLVIHRTERHAAGRRRAVARPAHP